MILPSLFAKHRFVYENAPRQTVEIDCPSPEIARQLQNLIGIDLLFRAHGADMMRRARSRLTSKTLVPKPMPISRNAPSAIVAGAGPSLATLDWDRVLEEKIYIVACGRAAKWLDANGVDYDLVIDTDFLNDWGDILHKTNSITSLCHPQARHAVAVVSVHRGITSWPLPSFALLEGCGTVVDTAIALCSQWGFPRIGLIGCDFAYGPDGAHHAGEAPDAKVAGTTIPLWLGQWSSIDSQRLAPHPGRFSNLAPKGFGLDFKNAPRVSEKDLKDFCFFNEAGPAPTGFCLVDQAYINTTRSLVLTNTRKAQLAYARGDRNEALQYTKGSPPLAMFERIESVYLQGKGRPWLPVYYSSMQKHASTVLGAWK